MSSDGRRADATVTDLRHFSVSTVRTTLESVFSRTESATVIDECRRCGTSVESTRASCPNCACDEIAEYRIQ